MLKPLCAIFCLFFVGVCFGQEANKDSIAAATLFSEAKSVFLSDKASCLNKAITALEIADRINNKPLQGNLNNLLGILYSYQAKYDLSLKHLNQALQFGTETKDNLLIAKAYSNMGLNYMQQGNQLKAIEASLKGAKLYAVAGNVTGLGNTYANISNSYYSLKNYDKSLAYGDSALRYFKQFNQQTGIANVYNTFGNIYADQLKLTKALDYYTMSLKIKRDIKDVTGEANALNNIGTLYDELKKYDKATENLNAAAKIYKQLDDAKGLTNVMGNLARIKAMKNDTTALKDSKIAFEYAQKNATVAQQRDMAQNVSDNFLLKKDYKNSLKFYKIYEYLKDSSTNEAMLKHVAELETKYQTEKKQQQITLLNKQSIIQRLEISKRNTTITVIAIVFILSLLIAYQFYSRNKIKHESKLQATVIHQQALASKGIIEAEEQERKRIAGELHDGVGQLFTTVKMNMEILIERFLVKQPDADLLAEKTMAMVDESCTEVRSIAHQMMPNALIKSGLVSALRDFINKIPNEKLKISLETKGIDKPLESTIETVLYRVIQESVNNVVKHAGATSLDILLLCDDKEITVSIEDNGKGFNTADKSKFTGIGLKNMISRVEYLKGSVDISSSPGKGTLVAIFIPLT